MKVTVKLVILKLLTRDSIDKAEYNVKLYLLIVIHQVNSRIKVVPSRKIEAAR